MNGKPTPRILTAVAAGVVALAPRAAAAQDDFEEIDIEVPVLILDEGPDVPGEDDDLNLRNIVQSAAKGVTTVQEAPAIVTVVTHDEIEDRGFTNLEQVIDTVPGWLRLGAIHSQFPFGLTRGQLQSFLYMRDGVSLFDPAFNVPQITRVVPLETVKRIEFITGPGGVLWGANSFLGIMNVITKDASDIDGVEAQVTAGHGNGDREMFRGYVMAGIEDLFGEDSDASLMVHSSFETFIGPGFEMPLHMYSAPLPQPNSNLFYGPLVKAQPPRSFLFNFDGKFAWKDFNLYFSAPYVERHTPLGFPGFVTVEEIPEDTLRDPDTGELLCPRGLPDPTSDYNCLDPDRRARDNQIDWFERYVIGEYRTRFAGGKAGATIKAYMVQFYRDFEQLGIIAPIPGILEGGLAFEFNGTSYRTGASYDGDLELTKELRLLYGVEGFHEWMRTDVERSRQGNGVEAEFVGPYNEGRLPLPCPRHYAEDGSEEFIEGCPLTFSFPASRTALGGYINPQYRPFKELILDAGFRYQGAPDALGKNGFDPVPLFSGTIVYSFIKNWHIKLNYAQGFRPPVFNNTNSNGEAVQVDGRLDIKTEKSDAVQGELNARLWKGDRRIREFNFRADYSYTRVENLIQLVGGRYENTGDRGIHSAEFLGKLYIQGGHRVELGYTWLQIDTEDKGRWKATPEHWFNLAGVFNLVDETLMATTALRVLGAMEDANRLIEHRNWGMDPETGRVMNLDTGAQGNLVVQPHELVLDRLPPSADLTIGLTYAPMQRLMLSAWVFNALNARYYQPDGFNDFEPRLEFLPNPYEDLRFNVSATYTY